MNKAGKSKNVHTLISIALLCMFLHSCSNKKMEVKSGFHFTLMEESETNIDFNNKLTENDSINFLTNQYIYIGSGVGVADFNNDGLQDIFFAGEQVSCKLYINKGGFKFEDVTTKAGMRTLKWCTGISIVDINNDGLMDVYVSVSHSRNEKERKNLLFINHSDLKFTEEATEYGLDDSGFSTQAAFFDYDNDGDLDMYLMNHNVFQNQPNNIVSQDAQGTSIAADKLYRNDGVPAGKNHPVFKDVSHEAGINDIGYGLGLAISDVNSDGWPDIYVANDFLSNDLLWMNNKNGTFTNRIYHSLHHQSYNSMGIDVADINNDHLPDIAVLDMQPETNYRKKTMFAGTNPERYDMEQKIPNYQPQFTRNMLQLNNGNRTVDSIKEPFFSEIGQLSGISETDWSWSVLMADFDNDGWKDVQITNGIAKDLTNNDFLFFRSSQAADGNDNNMAGSAASLRKDLDAYGSIKINNYFYHNNGDFTFSNTTAQTGMAIPSVSHGAVYADLDNDGDLDMVINNMNQQAFIWKNELRKTPADSTNNYLSIQLKGSDQNKIGIGTKATLYADGKVQFLEQNNVRGYMSSVDSRLHFGVSNAMQIDSIKIEWPDGKMQLIKKVAANKQITINYKDAKYEEPYKETEVPFLFADVTNELILPFKHSENPFFDFGIQRLLPQKYSQLGPPLITGDINGDGLTDVFVGGASYQSGLIFIQNNTGGFKAQKLVEKDKTGEDAGAEFFDADGDKDIDLLITEGSTEFGNSETMNVPRLYKNDGKGNFKVDVNAFAPEVSTIAQVVATADYDSDGDVDIFIGGRILTNQYPLSPSSYILQNNNGKFTDVTKTICAVLERPGMITGAVWTDFDNDKNTDLVICGEWMPIRFFKNRNGKLEEVTTNTGLKNMNGLWRSLQVADIDKDGDIDFIAGNMGLNNKYHTTPQQPNWLYAKDIDRNGSVDLIPAYYIKNDADVFDLFPGIDRTQFAEQVLAIKKKYLLNEDFAKINMNELLNAIGQKDMLKLKCETLASVWIENMGNGQFKQHELPLAVQFAPLNAILTTDVDNDGNIDLLLAGNEYQAEIGTGRYDASYGHFLKNDGRGGFTNIAYLQSGFILEGDVKALKHVITKNKDRLVLATVNDNQLKCLKINAVTVSKK